MEVPLTGWIHHCGKYCVRVCKLPSAHTQELQSLCDLTLQISPHPDTDILTHIDISMTMAAHCVKSFTLQSMSLLRGEKSSLCFAIQLMAGILLTTTVTVTGGTMVTSAHSTHLLHPGSGDHWW